MVVTIWPCKGASQKYQFIHLGLVTQCGKVLTLAIVLHASPSCTTAVRCWLARRKVKQLRNEKERKESKQIVRKKQMTVSKWHYVYTYYITHSTYVYAPLTTCLSVLSGEDDALLLLHRHAFVTAALAEHRERAKYHHNTERNASGPHLPMRGLSVPHQVGRNPSAVCQAGRNVSVAYQPGRDVALSHALGQNISVPHPASAPRLAWQESES